jgi:hypothetical protein
MLSFPNIYIEEENKDKTNNNIPKGTKKSTVKTSGTSWVMACGSQEVLVSLGYYLVTGKQTR